MQNKIIVTDLLISLFFRSKFFSQSSLKLSCNKKQLDTNVRFKSTSSYKIFPFHGAQISYGYGNPLGTKSRLGETFYYNPKRYIGNSPRGENDNILPPLMDNAAFYWRSSFFSRIKMWFQIRFTIRKFDPSFSMQEFLGGAHKALIVISTKLANKDYQGLEQLIEPSALNEIKRNMVHFKRPQRQALQVAGNDAYICFPHHIRITIPHQSSHVEVLEGKPSRRPGRIVEIVVVYHVWRGATMEEVQKRSLRTMMQKEHVMNFLICNYTFQRDYSEPKSSSWDVTSLMYFCLNPSKGDDSSGGGDGEGDAQRKRKRRKSKNRE